MQPIHSDITHLLLRCEEESIAPEYVVGGGEYPRVVYREGEERQVVVVSDLHLAAGLDADNRYGGTENFFSDEAFARFIEHMRAEVKGEGGILIINGDFLDFLRIIELPESKEEFDEWSRRLADVGIRKNPAELAAAIDNRRERTFGMKTHDYRSVWRLHRSIRGHPELFAALARWLKDERNQLVIVKGNHDLEWYWRGVRNTLRLELARIIAGETGEDLEQVLLKRVLPNLIFIDDALLIDTDLYIEHGHRYDRYTFVLGEPAEVFNKKIGEPELNIPFGSFFNRYLLNRLEGAYPLIDNIRPRENILPMLIRERFPLALKLIFYHLRLLYQVLRKNWRYVRFMLARFFSILLAVVLPAAILVIAFAERWDDIAGLFTSRREASGSILDGIVSAALEGFKYIGGLILSYFLARIVAGLQLEEPDSLEEFARKVMQNTDYRIVTMGHTHNPDQFQTEGRWFYNTGTWIPIVETSSGEIRRDRTYCYLHLRRDKKTGRLIPRPLQQWDDSGNRGEPWPIVIRK